MIKHKFYVSLKKTVDKPGYFPNHRSKRGKIFFMSMGQKIGLP